MKKGFDRLRGVAAAGAVGLGVMGAGVGSLRAAPTNTSLDLKIALAAQISSKALSASFTGIGSSTSFGISELSIFAKSAVFQSGPSPSSTTNYAFSDAFDGVLLLSVDGTDFTNPTAQVDLTDTVVTSGVDVDIAPGIDAQIQFAFDGSRGNTSMGLIRAMYTLTNTTGSEIATTINIYGNLGSDGSTTIQATSSGDDVADDADMWTVSSEKAFGEDPVAGTGYDPILLITRYGTGAAAVPTQTDIVGAGNGYFGNDYELTIPANSTQRVLVFIEAHSTNAGATAAAADFETLDNAYVAGLLTGVSVADLNTVVNYAAITDTDSDGAPDVADNCPANANADQADGDGDEIGDVCDEYPDDATNTPPPAPEPAPAPAPSSDDDDGILSMDLSGLFAMLGMLPVLRLLRKARK